MMMLVYLAHLPCRRDGFNDIALYAAVSVPVAQECCGMSYLMTEEYQDGRPLGAYVGRYVPFSPFELAARRITEWELEFAD